MTLAALPLPDLNAVEAAARRLAPHLRVHDLLALQGPLGAGKTTFARALLRGLGITEDVPSPTFTLLQIYETPQFPVYHFDLYRLESETELAELGWDDALADGLVIAEWPERVQESLPKDRLVMHFIVGDDGRRALTFEPFGAWIARAGNIK